MSLDEAKRVVRKALQGFPVSKTRYREAKEVIKEHETADKEGY